MKKSTILDVCHHSRGLTERVPISDKYFKLIEKTSNLHDKLIEKIEAYPDIMKLFDEFEDAVDAASSVEIDDFFVEGFKIGLLIGIEASEPYEPKEV
ncbi:MAG TPA: hypothetical protein DD415_05565 [Clostridiales bacterium]|nr:hypothetical protein [Clostridiales bacterium]